MTDILIFLGVFWGVWAIGEGLLPDRLSLRLQKNQAVQPWIQRIDPIVWGPTGTLRFFERSCDLMGALAPHRAKQLFLGYIASLIVSVAFTGLILRARTPDDLGLTMILAGGAELLLITGLWWGSLRVAIRAHQDALIRALPALLDVLCLCMESGLGLYAALERTVEYPLSPDTGLQDRIRRILQRLQSGDHLRRAIDEAQTTIDGGPVRRFLEMLTQVDRLGGGWVQALKKEVHQLNTMRRHRARERASRAGIQLMIPLILFELPALLALLIGPVMLKFIDSLQGFS